MNEAREVSAPETAAPQHQPSHVGKQRLAALTEAERTFAPDGQEHSQHRTEQPPVVRGADGGEASLEDGTYKPAERPAQETAVDVSVIPDLPVSAPFQEDMQAFRSDLAAIVAAEPSISASEASVIFEFAGLAAAADAATSMADGDWQQGQTVGQDLANPDATRQILRSKYGDMADALMAQAVKESASLPPSVRAWLDQDMGFGRRLGNSVQVVEALALRQFARQPPEAAQRELDQLRASKTYQSGDKLSIAKARMLGIVIAHAQPSATGSPFPTRDAGTPTSTVTTMVPKNSIRARIDAINSHPDLLSADSTKRLKLVKERAALQAKLEGGQA